MALSSRTASTYGPGAGAGSFDLALTGFSTGDLMLVAIAFNNAGASCTPPAGWVEVHDAIGAAAVLGASYYRVKDGSEGATATFTMGVAGQSVGAVAGAVYDPLGTLSVSAATAPATATDSGNTGISFPAVPAPGATGYLGVAFGCARGASAATHQVTTDPTGWTKVAAFEPVTLTPFMHTAVFVKENISSAGETPSGGVWSANNYESNAVIGLKLLLTPYTPPYTPQIIWLTPAPAAAPGTVAPTYESSISYASLANRPAVTGTTRPFASAAALNGALSAAAPGDLVSYTGVGVLDIAGNYTGFAGRRYAGYVNVDLGLAASANHVRFTGGGGAGLPAVGIYNSQYLRIYGGEITNPPPKSTGHDGLHIYGAGHAHDGSTNHITWWNLVVHDTVDSGIKLLPNVPFGGSGQTSADNTIADCDIEATVYMIGRDKTVDTHPEQGTGQHCCLLADTDPSGATYPSFLRNRVAIDGYNTGLSSSQGGGSIVELGFNDAASTISGCTLILRGNNTLFNAQQQTGGNGLNLWGDAAIGCAVPFIQHSNATGSAVSNYPPGQNRSGVVVAYGRHTSTNRNAYEGTNPWQIGPTYSNVA